MEASVACIGFGASGALLVHHWVNRPDYHNRKLTIFEPQQKEENDKTYCFWARPDEPIIQALNPLTHLSWQAIEVQGQKGTLGDYRYYKIPSQALYAYAKTLLSQCPSITWMPTSVDTILPEGNQIKIITAADTFLFDKVFDSRPPKVVDPDGKVVWQSFVGWEITTSEPVWSADTIKLMDFGVPQDGQCQFVYVLPSDTQHALVEITRFGTERLPFQLAEERLREYLAAFSGKYEINHVETGVLPMSQHIEVPFVHKQLIPIGTRAGQLKPSTGYGFKSMFYHTQALVSEDTIQPASWRFHFYDALLLRILKERPLWGKPIFEQLFEREPTPQVLSFLEEKSTILQEVSMFSRLPIFKFLWALKTEGLIQLKALFPRFAMPLFIAFSLLLGFLFPDYGFIVSYGLLAFFFISHGLPHGALDGYTQLSASKLQFISTYLIAMAAMVALWWASPWLALMVFIAYSGWHFGETDFEEWGIQHKIGAFSWGVWVLGYILATHANEVSVVIQAIGVAGFPQMSLSSLMVQGFWVIGSFVFSQLFSSKGLIQSALGIWATAFLPLPLAFGAYFVFQHSLHGWKHLSERQQWSFGQMQMMAAPYTLGALLMFALGWMFQSYLLSFSNPLAVFFVVLSALSFPHIFFISRWYALKKV